MRATDSCSGFFVLVHLSPNCKLHSVGKVDTSSPVMIAIIIRREKEKKIIKIVVIVVAVKTQQTVFPSPPGLLKISSQPYHSFNSYYYS